MFSWAQDSELGGMILHEPYLKGEVHAKQNALGSHLFPSSTELHFTLHLRKFPEQVILHFSSPKTFIY